MRNLLLLLLAPLLWSGPLLMAAPQGEPANAGSDVLTCADSIRLSGNEPITFSGLWSIVSGSGTLLNPTQANADLIGLQPGTTTLVWEFFDGPDVVSSDTVLIVVNEPPSAAEAGPNQNICGSSANLNASAPLIGTGSWSAVHPSLVFDNPNAANTTVNGLQSGTNELVWTVVSGLCDPSRDTVLIVVNETPSAAEAGPNQNICSSSANLNASAPLIGTGSWSAVHPSLVFNNPNAANTTVNGLQPGTNELVWTVSAGVCEPSRDTVLIVVNETPSAAEAGPNQTICSLSTTLNASAPLVGTGNWSVISGSAVFDQANQASTTVSDLSPGLNVLRFTVSNPPCEPSFDELNIVVESPPQSPDAGPNQNLCSSSTSLNASPASGGLWSIVQGTATLQNPNDPNSAVFGLTSGETILRWTVPGGTCGDQSDEISLFVDDPPTPANAGNDTTLCSSSFVLEANQALIGNGQWSVVSGNAVFDNPNSPNSLVSALAEGENTLRWTISNGVCAASTSEVTITVAITNLVANAGNAQNICTSNTQLSASPSPGGSWSVISGSANLENPTLANTEVSGLSEGATVLRWSIPNGVCGVVSDDVTITVQTPPSTANAGVDQNLCSTVAQLNGNPALNGNGLWSVVTGTATFANPALYNTTVSGLSVGSNVLRWTISNGNCTPSFDEVTLIVSANPLSPEAGPDQTICGSSTLLSATAASNGSWSVVQGSGVFGNATQANTSVSGLSSGVNVFRWTIDAGACGNVFDQVSITVDQPPSPAIAGNDQTICGSSTTLSATPPLIGAGTWSLQSGSAVFANATQANTSVSGLSVGINTLVWTVSNGVCPPSADEITVLVQASSASAVAGPDQTICSSQTQLAATPAANGVWSVQSGTASIANPTQANTTISALQSGSTTLRWTVPDGACGSVFDEVVITVQDQPTAANAGPDQNICSTTTPLAANTPVIGSGQWSVISGTAIFANANQPNSSVSGLSPGLNILRWTISNGVCAPSADDISIQVASNPLSPSAGPDQEVCSVSAVLSASPAGAGLWTVVEGSGTFANPTNSTTAVAGLSAGLNVFRWTIDAGACGTASDEVEITVSQPPGPANAGVDQTICATTTSLNASSSFTGNGVWTVVSGTGNFSSASNPQSTVSGLSPGLNQFQWTVSNGACPPLSDVVAITVQVPPASVNAGTDQQICGTSTSLNASPTNNGTWSVVSGSASIANPNLASSSVSGLGNGQTILRWTVSVGACPAVSDDVLITVIAAPTAAQAGPDQTLCSTNASLNANTPIVGIGQWSVVSGSATFSNAGSPNTAVSGLSPGQNILRWTISNGSCAPSQDELTITVQSPPTQANAGADQQICGTSATLLANTPLVGNGQWTVVSGSGVFGNPAQPGTTVSNLAAGLNVFRWTTTNGFCQASTDEVSIIAFAPPSPSQAGPDASICANSFSLNANTPIVGSGTWTVVSGTATLSNPALPNAVVSGLSAGTVTLRWTISNGVCSPSQDEITINILATPQANAGSDQQVCSPSATLSANAPGSGNTGIWVLISGSGTLSNPNSPNTQISNLGIGTSVFQWTVSNAQCPPASDLVSITRFEQPSPAVAGPDQQTCATSALLNAQQPLVGTGFWSVISGSGTLANPSLAATSVSALSSGLNQLRWTVSNGVCASNSDTVNIVVDANPTNAAAGPDQQICSATAILGASAPSAGTGLWSILSGSGTLSSPTLPNSSISGLSAGITVLRWTVSNGSCVSFDDLILERFQPPSAASASVDQVVCAPEAQLNGNIPLVGTGTWTVISGAGSFGNAGAASTSVSGLAPGANVFRWTLSNGPCPVSTDQVSLIREIPPSPAAAGPDTTICSDAIALYATAPTNGNGIWSIVSGGGTLSAPQSASSLLGNLGAGENRLIWTTLNGNCPASTDTLIVERFLPPSQANAGSDLVTCLSSIELNATAPVVGTGAWSLLSGSATLANPNTAQTTLSNLQTGLTFLLYTVSNGPCPTTVDQLIVERLESPGPANAGNDLETCASAINLQGNTSAAGIPTWTLISGNGSLSQTQGNNTQLSAPQNDTLLVAYTLSNQACSSTDTVQVVLWMPFEEPFAGNDTSICDSELLLSPIASGFTSPLWSVLSGNAFFNNPQSFNSQLVMPSAGQALIKLSLSNGICAPLSDTMVVIRLVQSDTATILNENGVVCDDTLLLNSSPDNGQWALLAGNADLSSLQASEITLSNMEEGEIVLSYSTTGDQCPSSDTLILQKASFPQGVNAGSDKVICGTEALLEAETPIDGNGAWSLLSGSGALSDPNDPNASFSRIEPGISRLIWEVSNDFCSSADTLTLNFLEQPEANAGPDLIGCLNDTLFLQAGIPLVGNGVWSSLNGGVLFFQPQFQNSGALAQNTGNYFLEWTVTNGLCSDSDLVVITFLSPDDPDCKAKEPEVFVPEGFSPNEDGVFDRFVVQIPAGKQLSLRVFDRWGNKVYESSNYQNDWDGKANAGLVIGADLPESTYYYLIEIEGESQPRKGYFTLWR